MATIQAFEAIHDFITTGWVDVAPVACPLVWDNEAIKPPEPFGPVDAGTGKATPRVWARILIEGDLWEQASIGGGDPAGERWDETGSVMVLAFAPINTGSRGIREVLTAFAEMCRGRDTGAIEFQDIRFDPIGVKDDTGKWWGMHIVIDWIRRG